MTPTKRFPTPSTYKEVLASRMLFAVKIHEFTYPLFLHLETAEFL
jgi:hypothetical protein